MIFVKKKWQQFQLFSLTNHHTSLVKLSKQEQVLLVEYLSFQSHHPLQHKLAVIRTLLERSDSIVTEEDRKQEEDHVRTALHTCGYPDWAINTPIE